MQIGFECKYLFWSLPVRVLFAQQSLTLHTTELSVWRVWLVLRCSDNRAVLPPLVTTAHAGYPSHCLLIFPLLHLFLLQVFCCTLLCPVREWNADAFLVLCLLWTWSLCSVLKHWITPSISSRPVENLHWLTMLIRTALCCGRCGEQASFPAACEDCSDGAEAWRAVASDTRANRFPGKPQHCPGRGWALSSNCIYNIL